MKVQSGSVAVLLMGMFGCSVAPNTTETAERIESPEWKDTITTREWVQDVVFSTAKNAASVILLTWKNGNSRCMPMPLILQCLTRWLRKL